MKEMLAAADAVYDDLVNLCVWNKTNAGMGSLYRSKHELIFVYRNGKGRHVNNVALGRFGRHRSNVWDYPGQNIFNGTAKSKLKLHPTAKPVALVADADPGRVAPGRGHSGSFRRRRFNADCGREDRPQSPTDRTRAALRRRDGQTVGGADGRARRTESVRGIGARRILSRRQARAHRCRRKVRPAKATPFRRWARRRDMTDTSGGDKTVGYKRPPQHTRFQPGVSGNPRGRQKGVRNFAADVKRTLEIPVTLSENGKSKRVSTQEALILRLREKALKGDARALETLLSLARTHNEDFAGHSRDRLLAGRPGDP